jgi:hypothetical protein
MIETIKGIIMRNIWMLISMITMRRTKNVKLIGQIKPIGMNEKSMIRYALQLVLIDHKYL